ncbi:ShET2/EspL2 family type III secretion system effector toxin [Imbroritus primus]|uniref:ShET2/EspL2 family type III secretion system effector toxin n=1 Tax=Imbroritus primus TaxID=3058603 RepID=A0ACD3SUY0_9BURK|nr:ShET2/EspL2 family type III secretion system effector toxin [Burkholderiaceae bacterium PBA]
MFSSNCSYPWSATRASSPDGHPMPKDSPGQVQAWRAAEQMVDMLISHAMIHPRNVTAFVRLFLGQAPPPLACTRHDYAASPPAVLAADSARTPREALEVMRQHLQAACAHPSPAPHGQIAAHAVALVMRLFVAEHGANAFDARRIFCTTRFLAYLASHGIAFSAGPPASLMHAIASRCWAFDAARSTSDAVAVSWRAAGEEIPLMPEWRHEKKFVPYRSIRAHGVLQPVMSPAVAALPRTQLAMWWAARFLGADPVSSGNATVQDAADRDHALEAGFRNLLQQGRRTLLPHAEWGNYLCEAFTEMVRSGKSRAVRVLLAARHPLVLGLQIKTSEAGERRFVTTLFDTRHPARHVRTVSRGDAAKCAVLMADDFLGARERMAYYTAPVSLVLDDRPRTSRDITIVPGSMTLDILHHLFDTGSTDSLQAACAESLRALPEQARHALLMAWFDVRCDRPDWRGHSIGDALREGDRQRIEAVQRLLEAAELSPAMQFNLFQKRSDDSPGLFWRSLGHACARHNIGRLLAPGTGCSLAPEQVLDLLTECNRDRDSWLCILLARGDGVDVAAAVAHIADRFGLSSSYRMLLARKVLQHACRAPVHERRADAVSTALRQNCMAFLQRIGLQPAQQVVLLTERHDLPYPLFHAAWMPGSGERHTWLPNAMRQLQLPAVELTQVLCTHDANGRSLLAVLLDKRLPVEPLCRWLATLPLSMAQREAVYRADDRDGMPCIVSLLRARRGLNAYACLLRMSGLPASQQYRLWRGGDARGRAACEDALRASDSYAERYRRRRAEFRDGRNAMQVVDVQRGAPWSLVLAAMSEAK